MDVRSAVELAREGLDMGHRVICSKLNAILAVRCPSLRIKCDDRRDGDSMELASEKIKDAWSYLLALGICVDRVDKIAPWTLGLSYPWPKYHVFVGHRLQDNEQNLVAADGFIDQFILRFYEEQSEWTEQKWQVQVVTPVEVHQSKVITVFKAIVDSKKEGDTEYTHPLPKFVVRKLYGIKETQFREWITQGKIPCIDVEHRTLRLRLDEYKRLLSLMPKLGPN